jgi:hypothetical protein
MPKDKKRVFLSYALRDKEFATQLSDLLRKRGASVFVDADTRPRSLWADVLRSEIEKATALILLIPSQDALDRNNLWFEAGAAKALGKPVLAVLLPHHKGSRAELPTDIADLLLLDADERSLESVADTLIQAVPEDSDSRLSAR